MDKALQEIIEKANENGYKDTSLIEKAYALAKDICREKDAVMGIEHNAAVAKGLAELGLDTRIICAGLLHNAQHYGYELSKIRSAFGNEIADMIEYRDKFELNVLQKGSRIEKTKKLFLSLTKDIRLIMLELVERVDLIKRPDKIYGDEKKVLVDEVREIYLPAAQKLGVYSITAQMQDFVFNSSHKEEYEKIAVKIRERAEEQRPFVEEITKKLRQKLKESGIEAQIKYRTKGVYAAYNKMQGKKKGFDEIRDICGIRAITGTIEDCYKILGVVNSLGDTIADEFDDYIAKPKQNGYQSIHTVISDGKGSNIEVQVRTKDMDDQAELGIAAHWRYKDVPGFGIHDSNFSRLREIFEWQKEEGRKGSGGTVSGRIFVFTPRGDSIELPDGATVIDFAYAIHSDLGSKCSKAKVNGASVSLDHVVKNADVVEIITSPSQKPKRQWLSFAKTDKARQKIRSFLGIKEAPKKEAKKKDIIIVGSSSDRIRLAKCCNPLPGDEITAFGTTKRKISVHVKGCEEAKKLMAGKKEIEIGWGSGKGSYSTEVSIVAKDRVGLFRDMMNVFSSRGINVETVDAKTRKDSAICFFKVDVKNLAQLMDAVEGLYKVKGVMNIKRGSL